MPSARNTRTAMSARVTPRWFRTTLKCRIRHSFSPPPGGTFRLVSLLDQGNALDQRAGRAAGRIAAGHETEEMPGYRFLAGAMPRAGALVQEHFGQVVELYRVTARTPAVLRRIVQSNYDHSRAFRKPARAGGG